MLDNSIKWGIPLHSLNHPDFQLQYVPEEFTFDPHKTINLREKFGLHREAIEDYWGWRGSEESYPYLVDGADYSRLKQKSRYFPVDPYFSEFSFDELAKYVFNDFVESEVSKAFERSHEGGDVVPPEPAEFVYKLRSSLHHYGSYPKSWNSLVNAYYAIPQFNFGLGFEVRFDHTRYYNEWGRGQHVQDQMAPAYKTMTLKEYAIYAADNTVYLDGIFAYYIYFNGKPALTVGFSIGTDEVLITQVQLRQKKGNRWLYQLPTDILNYAVEAMYGHFSNWGFGVRLVDGPSLAAKITKQHGEDDPVPQETQDRIARFYSQPLINLSRGDIYERRGLKFYKLTPH